MPWRVCRVLDFRKHCTSVHSNEEIAKIETANQLLSLVNNLEAEIPRYLTYRGYEKNHPGFVADLREMIAAVRRRIEDGDVWGAYDDWHRFLQYWDRLLQMPIWVDVGTVVVDGPGPTVTPEYDPKYLEKSLRYHPKKEAVSETTFDMEKAAHEFVRDVLKLVQSSEAGQGLDPELVVQEIRKAMNEIDFNPVREQDQEWAWGHYFELVIKNVYERFGITYLGTTQ